MNNKYKNLTVQERVEILRKDLPQEMAEAITEKLFRKSGEATIFKEKLSFNKTTGMFRIGKKSAKFSKKSKHYKLINILWENHHRIVEYPEISSYLWDTTNVTADVKRNIHQVVYEIKEKLGLTKNDQTVFFCNEGYMLQGVTG